MSNPKIADAPCLRCGKTGAWKRNAADRAYLFCTRAGGCGAQITLGDDDPFPDPLHLGPPAEGIGDAPAPDPRSAPAHPAKPKAQPEPEPDDGSRAKPGADDPGADGRDDDGNPWGLY